MLDLSLYMKQLIEALQKHFSTRLLYVGLQGSFRRKEADRKSDIDIFVVLDTLDQTDLDDYRAIINLLPEPERSCGFICGKKDLQSWNAFEICQLSHETQDYYGTLAPLLPPYTRDDVLQQVKITSGNLYHLLCHSYIHAPIQERETLLKAAFKQVFYILQNWFFWKSGQFILTKQELLQCLQGDHHKVLETAIALRAGSEVSFQDAFPLLLRWCQSMLEQTNT